MFGGYTGKMLLIDLDAHDSSVLETDMDAARDFIGAKGLGAKILFDRLPKGTDPLSPGNILMFTTGPLTGTTVQTSGRGTVVTKSPLTGLYLDSHFGGAFAPEMKKAGWDFIIFEKRSRSPVYVVIQDESIGFEDASEIWGKECLNTHKWLLKKHGKVKTAVIGPAGENQVRYAAITVDGHRHAGRGGSGAVMGSKNLKAVAVAGSGKISLHDETGFRAKAKEVLKKIQSNDFIPMRRRYGTPYWVKPINDWGFIPTRNYQEGRFEHADEINAFTMQERIVEGSGSCFNCVIACWNLSSIKSGAHKGVSLVGPEYETIALMGSNLGVGTIEEVACLNERCNELGMDTISMGGVLGFAIEAYEKGVITKNDLRGHDIGWGKTEELIKLMGDIAYKRGKAGSILAEGVLRAAEKLGQGSERYAVHVKGLEVPGYDPRGAFGIGLAYATSDRGACHERAWTAKVEVMNPELKRFSFEKKAELVKEIQDERAAFFSLVLCDFAPISEEDCVSLWNLATGFSHTLESYLMAGERIWNLIRLFNLREGLKTSEDRLPWRIFHDPFTEGPAKDVVVPYDEFQRGLQEYYSIRGWNKKGIPTREKLKELNLTKYGGSY
jgi:aldehyde:ferredoxin oxidoreductase